MLRRGPIEVAVECGGERHRMRCDGSDLVLLDHTGDDAEMVLAILGGDGSGRCFDIAAAWRAAHPDDVPRSLRTLVVERWRAAGVAPSAIRDFLRGTRGLTVRPAAAFDGVPAIAGALWTEVLGTVPTPEMIRPLFEVGVAASEAVAWQEALGRVPTADAIVRARADGVRDGFDARLWRVALGHLPSADEIRRWHEVEVFEGYDACCWAEVAGRPLTPDLVAAQQRAGITDPGAKLFSEN